MQMSNTSTNDSHGPKPVTITINTKEYTLPKDRVTYEEVVAFPYPSADYNTNTYKVTYFCEKKNKDQPSEEGTLTKGQSMQLKDGLVFTVLQAVRS